MAINLGAKEPKREISLGRFGSIVVIGIFFLVTLSIAWLLISTFIIGDDFGQTYINCNDGSVDKITEGVFTYCGEYVGADTPAGIKQYLNNLNNFGVNNDFNIDLEKDLVSIEE